MKKKLVVIGAGMASGRLLEHLFETAPDAWQVTLFNGEPRGNYNRLMLSPVLSGDKTYDDIVTHDAHLQDPAPWTQVPTVLMTSSSALDLPVKL